MSFLPQKVPIAQEVPIEASAIQVQAKLMSRMSAVSRKGLRQYCEWHGEGRIAKKVYDEIS